MLSQKSAQIQTLEVQIYKALVLAGKLEPFEIRHLMPAGSQKLIPAELTNRIASALKSGNIPALEQSLRNIQERNSEIAASLPPDALNLITKQSALTLSEHIEYLEHQHAIKSLKAGSKEFRLEDGRQVILFKCNQIDLTNINLDKFHAVLDRHFSSKLFRFEMILGGEQKSGTEQELWLRLFQSEAFRDYPLTLVLEGIQKVSRKAPGMSSAISQSTLEGLMSRADTIVFSSEEAYDMSLCRIAAKCPNLARVAFYRNGFNRPALVPETLALFGNAKINSLVFDGVRLEDRCFAVLKRSFSSLKSISIDAIDCSGDEAIDFVDCASRIDIFMPHEISASLSAANALRYLYALCKSKLQFVMHFDSLIYAPIKVSNN